MAGNRVLEQLISPQKQAVAYIFPEVDDPIPSEIFIFQYWPSEISDSYGAGYSKKTIPGGSHKLHQYVGGGDRTISFSATFTSELLDPGLPSRGIPSSRFSVNLVAAQQRLRSYQHPLYRQGGQLGVTEPPPRLNLVLPNLWLGRDQDPLLVLLTEASFKIAKSYPDGTPRIMTADLTFEETVQFNSPSGVGVKFIGRERYFFASRYRFRDGNTSVLGG